MFTSECQPLPLFYVIHACVDPSFVTPSIPTGSYWGAAFQVQSHGTFLETLRVNLWEGRWKHPGSKFGVARSSSSCPLLLLIPSFRLSAATGSGRSGTGHRDSQTKPSETENSRQRPSIRQKPLAEGLEAGFPPHSVYSWGQLRRKTSKTRNLPWNRKQGSLLTPFYNMSLVSRQVKTIPFIITRMVKKK